jgi:hypothetical protein
MAFEAVFNDTVSGEPKIAHVSFFVWEENHLAAIYSVKGEGTPTALANARSELDNFVNYIETLKVSPDYSAVKINLDGKVQRIKDIQLNGVRKVTCGPRGSKQIGFDEELRFSQEQLENIAKQVLSNAPESQT